MTRVDTLEETQRVWDYQHGVLGTYTTRETDLTIRSRSSPIKEEEEGYSRSSFSLEGPVRKRYLPSRERHQR